MLADGIHYVIYLKRNIKRMLLERKVRIRAFLDSKSLFDVITRNKKTTEKRLMVDVIAMREVYVKMEIDDMRWIRSERNPSDALNQVKDNLILNHIIDQGMIEHPI